MKSSTNGSGPKQTLLERYQATAQKLDVLPPDEFIAEQWGCDQATPGRMRGKLKVLGFGFARRNGVWYVVRRPDAGAPAAPAAVNGVQQQLVIQAAPAPEPQALEAVPTGSDSGAVVAQLARIADELAALRALLAQNTVVTGKGAVSQWPDGVSVW
jgi:hypothetical protein